MTNPQGQQVEKRRAVEDLPEEIINSSVFTDDQLREASSWDDFMALAQQELGGVRDAGNELGDGFSLLEDKDRLIGAPLMLLEWTFRNSDMGVGKYVSVRCVARFPNGTVGKYIINDGSTGICEQLAKYQKNTGRVGGLLAHKGLRRSNYTVEIDGQSKAATTYYIDTAALQ